MPEICFTNVVVFRRKESPPAATINLRRKSSTLAAGRVRGPVLPLHAAAGEAEYETEGPVQAVEE